MENRYLYRGKRIDNGEWVEGYYVKGLDMYDKEVHMIFEPGTIFYSSGETDGWVEVEASTICRCTGYDGIYEKDIFRCEDEDYVIKWSEDSLRWEATSLETDVSVPLGDINPNYMVVIGNEIDNPELLEV